MTLACIPNRFRDRIFWRAKALHGKFCKAPDASDQEDSEGMNPFQYLCRSDFTFIDGTSFSSLMIWWQNKKRKSQDLLERAPKVSNSSQGKRKNDFILIKQRFKSVSSFQSGETRNNPFYRTYRVNKRRVWKCPTFPITRTCCSDLSFLS